LNNAALDEAAACSVSRAFIGRMLQWRVPPQSNAGYFKVISSGLEKKQGVFLRVRAAYCGITTLDLYITDARACAFIAGPQFQNAPPPPSSSSPGYFFLKTPTQISVAATAGRAPSASCAGCSRIRLCALSYWVVCPPCLRARGDA
jgi:hypothetical protein